MIFGIGADLVDIPRIESLLLHFGESFVRKVLTPLEQTIYHDKPSPKRAAFLAKRFAAKEALLKALGTGLTSGISWHDMEITSTPSGAPYMSLSGQARAHALTASDGKEFKAHLSLSDSQTLAQAFVTLESI